MKLKLIMTTILAASLSACGDGGNSSMTAAVVPPPIVAPSVLTPGDLQTKVPSLSYVQSSPKYLLVTAYNDFRSKLGLGLLTQNSLLDIAASNRLHYVLANDINNGGAVNMSAINTKYNRPQFHIEDSTKPLHTGDQEIDRASHTGYVGEEGAYGGQRGGMAAFNSLVATVYYRSGLMLQFPREIGISVGTDPSQKIVMELGYQKDMTDQYNAIDYLGAYPSNNQTPVPLYAGIAPPNPFPDLSTVNDDFPKKTSFPISVTIKEGQALKVGRLTVTEAGQSTQLDVRLMTHANDPSAYLARTQLSLLERPHSRPIPSKTFPFLAALAPLRSVRHGV